MLCDRPGSSRQDNGAGPSGRAPCTATCRGGWIVSPGRRRAASLPFPAARWNSGADCRAFLSGRRVRHWEFTIYEGRFTRGWFNSGWKGRSAHSHAHPRRRSLAPQSFPILWWLGHMVILPKSPPRFLARLRWWRRRIWIADSPRLWVEYCQTMLAS